MTTDNRLDPTKDRLQVIAMTVAWSGEHGRTLLAMFLRRFADDPRTCQAFDELPPEDIARREQMFADDLVAVLERKLRAWLFQNNTSAITPQLPQPDDWTAISESSVEEYFEDFARRLLKESR